MNLPRDAKPFKELVFPASAKANARVLANMLATQFGASITGTHREQTLHLKEPASLQVILRRTGATFVWSTAASTETDAVVDTIDAIEALLNQALGLTPEDAPEDNEPVDVTLDIAKAIVRCLTELELVTFATKRSSPQLEKKLAEALREGCESVEEIAECIMECSGVAELHASDDDLAEILGVCLSPQA